MDIIIPTCHPRKELKPLIHEIERTTTAKHNIIITGYVVSAAVNRNYGLHRAKSDIVCMLDDDIAGFYLGWDDDLEYPFEDPQVSIVTARLMTVTGDRGIMMGWQDNYPMEPEYMPLNEKYIPTACIVFKHNGVFFDENFVGSGFEDTDWCDRMSGVRVLANKCKLIHLNEQKNQQGEIWRANEAYYRQKWGR